MPPWLDLVLFLTVALVLGITYSMHFVMDDVQQRDTMVAYVGLEHVRLFERQYHSHYDLWAFGHRPRKSSRVRFEKSGVDTALKMFENMHQYSQMLLLYRPRHVPIFETSQQILEYRVRNDTVAYLLPKHAVLIRQDNTLESVLDTTDVDVLHLF